MVIFRRPTAATLPPPLPIPEGGDKPKNIVHVQGTGGSGKTLYAKAVVRARARAGGRVVIIDPNSTFGDYGSVVSATKAAAALAAAGARPFVLVVRPLDFEEELSTVFEAAFNAGRLLLVVDEAAEFGGRLRLDTNFLRVVQKGRNRLVDVLTTFQTPTDIDPRVRAQWSVAVTFRLAAPLHARQFADEYLRRPELAPELLRLRQWEYVRAEFGGRITRGSIPDPRVHGAP